MRVWRQGGPLMAIGSLLLSGASTPAAKLLLGNLDPQLLAGFLSLGSGLGLGASSLVRCFPAPTDPRPR